MIQKDTCTPMLTEALFTRAKTWTQPKCPSTEEWIKKMWYVYTMEYYSATNITQQQMMNLEIFILSEVGQEEKDKYHMTSPICEI